MSCLKGLCFLLLGYLFTGISIYDAHASTAGHKDSEDKGIFHEISNDKIQYLDRYHYQDCSDGRCYTKDDSKNTLPPSYRVGIYSGLNNHRGFYDDKYDLSNIQGLFGQFLYQFREGSYVGFDCNLGADNAWKGLMYEISSHVVYGIAITDIAFVYMGVGFGWRHNIYADPDVPAYERPRHQFSDAKFGLNYYINKKYYLNFEQSTNGYSMGVGFNISEFTI